MWVEQFPNAKVLTNREAVATMVNNAKKAGFTSIGLDVKGPEGYVSYRKNDLSKTPYLTATKNPNKQVKDDGFDLLEVVLQEAHKIGLKVYTSFNFFTEGNITVNDYAILHEHKDWEEIVQRPEDKGKLLKITESTRGKEAAKGKLLALAFVNPSNKEVQDFQLLRVEEVLKNYDIDGIVLDRCRYDNLYADFSHVTRNAFEEYLEKEGKILENFPADAFKIDKEGTLVKGQFFKEWITFRSQTICDFTGRIRSLVDKYKTEKNPDLKMAAYVGSWYEVYYQNGVNWASNQFKYDDRLSFPDSEIYGENYNKTSYLNNLDFLMIGTYYKTPKEVNRYITLGNILTCGQIPLLGSMSLPDLSVTDQGKVFGASLKNSSGLMIFDNCYVDWNTFFEQMKIAFSIKKK
ncbi:family 10 glycosylhydrolase [Bacteroides ovatus]|nr:family 10 glycosylhydrolase [Bacteroides ovatus]